MSKSKRIVVMPTDMSMFVNQFAAEAKPTWSVNDESDRLKTLHAAIYFTDANPSTHTPTRTPQGVKTHHITLLSTHPGGAMLQSKLLRH